MKFMYSPKLGTRVKIVCNRIGIQSGPDKLKLCTSGSQLWLPLGSSWGAFKTSQAWDLCTEILI